MFLKRKNKQENIYKWIFVFVEIEMDKNTQLI
jgi:hypothetical protein